MVVTNAIRLGGDEFDQAIIKHVRSFITSSSGSKRRNGLKSRSETLPPKRTSKRWRSRVPTPSLAFPVD
jgi:rod shape-determining protein MreB